MARRVGLIAGGGAFPLLFARAAREQGCEVVCVAHQGETDPAIERHADQLTWVSLGQLNKLVKALKAGGAAEVVLAGAISKQAMYHAKPDLKAMLLLAKLRDYSDDAILRLLAQELEANGLKVANPIDYLHDMLAPAGRLAGPKPTPEQMKDVAVGMRLAREIGRLDIGQTVVVKTKAVVAVEAMEGTDACIKRAAELCGPGAVVAKACKPIQDVRFDLPAVGPRTIEVMAKARAAVLAVEAGKTIVFEREELARLADGAAIAVLAVEE